MLTVHYAMELELKIRRQDPVSIVMKKGWEQIVAVGASKSISLKHIETETAESC